MSKKKKKSKRPPHVAPVSNPPDHADSGQPRTTVTECVLTENALLIKYERFKKSLEKHGKIRPNSVWLFERAVRLGPIQKNDERFPLIWQHAAGNESKPGGAIKRKKSQDKRQGKRQRTASPGKPYVSRSISTQTAPWTGSYLATSIVEPTQVRAQSIKVEDL